MKRLVIFTIILLSYLPSWSYGEEVQISLITVGVGASIESIYGHNAIRVRNTALETDITYNYGTFDFETPGFVLKFMRGQLPYRVSTANYENFLNYYHRERRSVTEQILELDSLEKTKIIQFLEFNILPENREYMYDFFMDNCATRLRDILNNQITDLKWDDTQSSQKTFRQIIKEYQKVMPWTDFGIDLIIGANADKKTDLRLESFIPDYLMTAVSHATKTSNGKKLERSKIVVLDVEQESTKIPFFFKPIFLFIVLLLLEINLFFRGLNNKVKPWIKKYDTFWIIILAICSLLMLFMWWGTDHVATKNNWNLLWANPLLPLWYFGNKLFGKHHNIVMYSILGLLFVSLVNAIPNLQFLPQYFNFIVSIISVILLLKIIRIHKSSPIIIE